MSGKSEQGSVSNGNRMETRGNLKKPVVAKSIFEPAKLQELGEAMAQNNVHLLVSLVPRHVTSNERKSYVPIHALLINDKVINIEFLSIVYH